MSERKQKAQYISNKIKNLRELANMTQSKLAEHSGITASAISQIEAGNRIPSLIAIRKISEALHISIQELTGDDIYSSAIISIKAQIFYVKYQDIDKLDADDQKTILNLASSLYKKQQKN